MVTRKGAFRIATGIVALVVLTATASLLQTREARAIDIMVYATPTCSCCQRWMAHLTDAGFNVHAQFLTSLTGIRVDYGIEPWYGSCHTAAVDGYVVEGHVPADVIRQLLTDRPEVAGIAVPGMPLGAPGMEADRHEPYNVLTFDRDGSTVIYARR